MVAEERHVITGLLTLVCNRSLAHANKPWFISSSQRGIPIVACSVAACVWIVSPFLPCTRDELSEMFFAGFTCTYTKHVPMYHSITVYIYIYTRACLSLLVLYIRMYLRAYMYTCMHLHIQLHAHVLADIYELCLPLSLPSNCIMHSDMATGNQSMSTPPAQHELSHRSHSLAIRATSFRGPVDVNDFSDKDDKHYKFGLGIPQHPGPLDSESVSYVVRYWLQVKRFRQAHLCK